MRKVLLVIAVMIVFGFFLVWLSGCEETAQSKPNAPIAQQINFVGDSSTRIYHMPKCKKCPHESQIVPLDSPLSATQAGFKPCKYCKPPHEDLPEGMPKPQQNR
ncbi:MAG: Ada metal-binding domain-containing protein [Candidatus Eremiobacteraeota bacterium]|nr:Ada metal-binding domain-containing protein [Candidatus Eremiobacteraeota bacterium]